MNRRRALSPIVLAVVLVVAWSASTAPSAWAESQQSRQMTVVIADGEAVRASSSGPALLRSLVGLISMLQDGPVTFVSVDDPSDFLGPFKSTDRDFRAIQDHIEASLVSPPSSSGADLPDALAEAHGLLGEARADAGSAVYVVTGFSPRADFSVRTRHTATLIPRFGDRGWVINGVSLPGSSSGALKYLSALASGSGGDTFELSVSDGFSHMADSILGSGARGSLFEASSRRLTRNEVMTSLVKVPPGTRETTILFARESAYGSLRLSNPSGLEASAGDRTASYVLESPYIVVWKLTDPAPGNWRIDVRGMEGLVSSWQRSTNKYSLVLDSSGPQPLDAPISLVAHVEEDGGPVLLKDAQLSAAVTGPGGAKTIHEMKGRGDGTDPDGWDGYFSVTLAPLPVEGSYKVDLELSWPGQDYRISSQTSFEASPFPSIQVKPSAVGELRLNERIQVATVFVHVDGAPYAVEEGALTALLSSPDGETADVEMIPRRLFGSGPTWEYDVYLRPQQEGAHSLVYRLDVPYAGREYRYTAGAFAFSSVAPPPVASEASSPAPVPVVAPQPVAASSAPASEVPAAAGFPWVAMAVAMTLATGIAAAAGYLLTRPRPYGYLYDDKDEPLVDFAKVKRHPVVEFLFRSSIRGNELNVPGLEGLMFNFSRDRIRLFSGKEHPTVRVNNQPLTSQATIRDRTWIGTGGRLYTFLTDASLSPESAGAD